MKTYPLADGLSTSRIGYGCMHLSRAWDASPITADERRNAQRLIETALPEDAASHDLPGIGRNLQDMADYFKKWQGKATHFDTKKKNPVAYDEDKGLIIIIQGYRIHAYKLAWEKFAFGGRYEPLT